VTALISASTAIPAVLRVIEGLPACIAGSSVVAALDPATDLNYDDVDVFCHTPHALIAAVERFLHKGFHLADRSQRVWARWLKYGFKGWHTNSIKLQQSAGIEVNLVYKMTEGHPATSLAQVIESFDFGLLAVGYEGETGQFRDARSYLFPGLDPAGPLPMMPNKRDNWRNGFISQYNGLREVGRLVKYHDYGYDMSLVIDDLQHGYFAAADYFLQRDDDESKMLLGRIYESIGQHIDSRDWDRLREAGREILFLDDLDQIMEHLE